MGLFAIGFALGPTLGGLIISFSNNILSVFYIAAAAHFFYAVVVWIIVPESLTRKQMLQSAIKHNTELADQQTNPGVGILVRTKRLFKFLSPLAILFPDVVDANNNPLKRRARDWNLLIVVLAYAFAVSIMGSYLYKFQYAASTFGWGPDIMGYWLSIMGASRAIHLTLILPLTIYVVKSIISKHSSAEYAAEREPLVASSSTEIPSSEAQPTHKPTHSPSFDLNIARISLLIEVFAYTLMALVTNPFPFLVFSMVSSLGSGLNPALQAVALELYTRRNGMESGKLFGALSVVSALSSQILGPAIYGLVYMKTVATMPRAIFFLSVASVSIPFILLTFVRIPKNTPVIIVTADGFDEGVGHPDREATLVGDEPGRKVQV